jgi:hypothetical protein
MFHNKVKAILITVITLTALSIASGTAWAVPPLPSDYSGTVYVGGVQAGAGLVVTAGMTGWNSSEGAITDTSGAYWLGIAPPESVSGTINFYVNGVQASETHAFSDGESVTNFNLHITALPTPTPTPTAIPISSNGSSSIGTSGGTANTSDGTITITFPSGAFNASTNVSIQGGTCHAGTSGFVVGSTCFNVTTDGSDGVLGAPATICVNLSAFDFTIVGNKSDLTLGYWFNSSWVEAGNVTLSGITLCGQTNHLSSWAVLGSTVNGTPVPTSTPSASPTPTTTGSLTPTTTPQSTASPTPTHTPSEEDEGGTNWALVGGIAGGVLLLAVIIIAINSRNSGGGKGSRSRRSNRKAKPKK